MPIRAVNKIYSATEPPVEVGIQLIGVGQGGSFSILYADIPGNSWNPQRLNKFVQKAQDLIDVRIPLTDSRFQDEFGTVIDPDALVDPARPDFFHDSGDLVARSVIISDVTFANDVLDFTLTRAR